MALCLNNKWFLPSIFLAVGLSVATAGCGPDKVLTAKLEDLRGQVAELNRDVTDAHVRIEELGNRVYILQDLVERAKVGQNVGAPPGDLKTVKLVPKSGTRNDAADRKTPLVAEAPAEEPPKVFSNWDGRSPLDIRVDVAPMKNRSRIVRDYEEAYAFVKAKRYEKAISAFDVFLKRYRETSYRDNAVFWTGVSRYELGRINEAATDFRAVMEMKNSNKKADSMYYLGLCDLKTGNEAGATRVWERLIKDHPSSEAARKATNRLRK